MSSNAGDILREDELKFMNVEKNYFVLTQSVQLTEQLFKKKIFYPCNKIEDLNSFKLHIKKYHSKDGKGDGSLHEENGYWFRVTEKFYNYVMEL